MLTSDDSGETWTEHDSGTSWNFASVAFDANSGRTIAVGGGGTVLTSDDGGATWTERATGASAQLHSVAFDADSGRAIAVGGGGTVLISDDSGATWSTWWTGRISSGASPQLHSVAFDAGTGRTLAVGGGGTVFTSDNGGATWTERATGASAQLHSVAFDAGTGRAIAVGGGGTVLTSADSGATWTEHDSGTLWNFASVAFDAESGHAIAVGRDGTVLTSTDNGDAWTERASGSLAQIESVVFDAGSGRAIAVGRDGTVLTSTDNGDAWTERASGVSAQLYSVAFDAGSGRAIAVGSGGTVLTSADNGRVWAERASGVSAQLYSVAFDAGSGRAIAVGSGGTVLTSADNGRVWAERASGVSAQLYSVAFDAGSGRAIAVGSGGTVLTSADNGETWAERASGVSAQLYSVAFDAGSGRAIAVGSGGTVLTSADNGETWAERASGVSAQLHSVVFDAGTERAIAVGDRGTVLTSDDNGETWAKRASGISAPLYSVAFDAGTARAIAMGIHLTQLTSDDAGATWAVVKHKGRVYPAPLCVLGLLLSLGGLILLLYQLNQLRRASSKLPDSAPGTASKMGGQPTSGSPSPRRSISDEFVSDRPLGPGDPDRLGYSRYVQGLSGLLRNTNTGFPITVAITGEWGVGKSSFMRLLEDDLKRRGYFSAWFNAWHDQNEEDVLSSLLQTIRKQALPRFFSRYCLRAIELRISLLRSQWIISVIAIMVLIFLVATAVLPLNQKEDICPAIQVSIGTCDPFYVMDTTVKAACERLNKHNQESSGTSCNDALTDLKEDKNGGKKLWFNAAKLREEIEALELPHPGYTVGVERALLDNVEHVVATPSCWTEFGKLWPDLMGGVWRWVVAFLVAVIVIIHRASAFGLNLRRGVAGIRGTVGLFLRVAAYSVDPAGRHEQLGRDFRNVSRSIGRNLVIFIDDLDRCQPEKVVETLEAMNFLVTAGECAVVMGMDYQRVQDCVLLARRDLAEAGSSIGVAREDIKAERRTAYAHKYLQKLVNVEMPIAAEHERMRYLFVEPEPEPPAKEPEREPLAKEQRTSVWKSSAWPWGKILPVIAIAVSVLFAALYVRDALVPDEPFVVIGTIPDDKGKSTVGGALQAPVPQPPPTRDGEIDQTTKPAIDTTPTVVFWPVIVGLSLVPILGLLLVFYRLHGRAWLKLRGVIATWFPRSLGRPDEVQDSEAFKKAIDIWHNAILCDEPTPRALKRFVNRVRYFAAMLHAENEQNFDWKREANLVALAVLHHLKADLLQTTTLERSDLLQRAMRTSKDERIRVRNETIIDAYEMHVQPGSWNKVSGNGSESPWPPSTSEIEKVREFSDGIHV